MRVVAAKSKGRISPVIAFYSKVSFDGGQRELSTKELSGMFDPELYTFLWVKDEKKALAREMERGLFSTDGFALFGVDEKKSALVKGRFEISLEGFAG